MPMTPEEEAAKKAEDDKRAAEEKAFNDKVNAAVTARVQRMEKAFEAKLEEFRKLLTPAAPAEPDDEGEGEGEGSEPAAEAKPSDKAPQTKKVDPVAKRALALAKKAQEEAAAERKKREEIEAQRMEQEKRSATKSALDDAGCTGALQRAAMALLNEEGRIGRDSEGNLVFKTSKKVHGETIIEEEPLADGVKSWLATDEGKNYMPPKDVAGSGATKGRDGGAGGKNLTKEQRREQATRTLLNFAIGGGR